MLSFKDVYSEYYKSIYRFLLSLSKDENISEELVQETFYRAFLNIDQFKGESSIYTWLCQIAKNAWYKECRRRKRFDHLNQDSEEIKKRESILDGIIAQEELEQIVIAMDELEAPYVDVFIMHIYGEKKLSEIANYFGKSESWARVTYYRAKAKIIEIMEDMKYEL